MAPNLHDRRLRFFFIQVTYGVVFYHRHIASHICFFLGGENKSADSRLHYYAYRKIIAVKMVFVRFLTGGNGQRPIVGTAPSPLWQRACSCTCVMCLGDFKQADWRKYHLWCIVVIAVMWSKFSSISVECIQLDPLNFYQEHLCQCLSWEGMTTSCWRDIVVHVRGWHSFPFAL